MFTTGASIQVQWYFLACIKFIDNCTLFLQNSMCCRPGSQSPSTCTLVDVADGVDVVSGLGDSYDGQWSGDVDLNDGECMRGVRQVYSAPQQVSRF